VVEKESPRGTRWTEFRGQGFWSRDGLLQLWLALLVDEIDRRGTTGWLRAMRDDWLSQARISFEGLMSSQLDEHIDSEPRRQEAVALCRDVQQRLSRSELDATIGLHARQIGGQRWQHEGTVAGLGRVAGSFVWLLDGPWGR